VIASDAATAGNDTWVAAYEELRRRVLAGAGACDLGQIFLLREGMTAWLAHQTTRATTDRPAADRDQRVVAPVLPNEIHAGMVRLLANMALAGRREMTP
jgi:hypothetical protein